MKTGPKSFGAAITLPITLLVLLLVGSPAHASFADIFTEAAELLTAELLVDFFHETGHQRQSTDLNVPMSWTFGESGPHWRAHSESGLTLTSKSVSRTVQTGIGETWTTTTQYIEVSPFDVYQQRTLLIAGAGFRGQQFGEGLIASQGLRRRYLAVSALHKIGYAIFPGSLQPGVGTGDTATFRDVDAQSVAQVALLASGMSDLWRAYRGGPSDWRLDFWQNQNGTPGLVFTSKW